MLGLVRKKIYQVDSTTTDWSSCRCQTNTFFQSWVT